MELARLLAGTTIKRLLPQDGACVSIGGICLDSRKVREGDLFAALPGTCADGNRFVADALARGARAVLTECVCLPVPEGKVFIEVEDVRAALARVSANFYGNPSQRLWVTGITGTNGKTTTSYLVKAGLEAAALKTGLIGTIKYIIGGKQRPAPFTTPEAPEFQRLLADMLSCGATHVVAEVSSHALAQKRADSTRFKTAVFTNLTRDHLDYHITMEDYYLSKLRLFAELLDKDGTAVIGIDDPYGRRLVSQSKAKTITYSMDSRADLMAERIRQTAGGLQFDIIWAGRRFPVNSTLIGLHNVRNILAAFGALVAQGVAGEVAIRGIESVRTVAGRFEPVGGDFGFLVVVDYAHTPDALERALTTARSIAQGRVITVFGCGGNRDRGKRPLMGHVASSLSDFAIITSDNPRGEDPLEIIEDIARGIPAGNYDVVPDRAEAIRKAVAMACPGDVVVLAGKGHEDYQDTKDGRLRFSDREEAENALREKGCLR